MWSEFLNESRSTHRFENRPVIVLGSKHSGKRSLLDSLVQQSKTTKYGKKADGNRMRIKGMTSAIDYSYLNVIDQSDPQNRTHSKLQLYVVEDYQNISVFQQLAQPTLLKQATIVIMLDFTSPWNFISELERWAHFILQLQRMANLPITVLDVMAGEQEHAYKSYGVDDGSQLLPLPEGVLSNNLRMPLIVCVNKSDLQSQVLREDSVNKLMLILYHLRMFCIRYGASLIYTSIKNHLNLSVLYEEMLFKAYKMKHKRKSDHINEEAIFIPFGSDSPTLVRESVIKINVEKTYGQIIVAPVIKKTIREECMVEEDSEFFKKYINTSQSNMVVEPQKVVQRQQADVKVFFETLLASNNTKTDHTERLKNAERELMKHTTQAMNNANGNKESDA